MALVSARATINALDVLTLVISSYLYILCQALDLRAINALFNSDLKAIVRKELDTHFSSYLPASANIQELNVRVFGAIQKSLDSETLIMDVKPRMQTALAASSAALVDFLATHDASGSSLSLIPAFRNAVASQAVDSLVKLREEFLTGTRGKAPAAQFLGRTRPVYEFVRAELGVKMHGMENFTRFKDGFTELTIGQNVTSIYEVSSDMVYNLDSVTDTYHFLVYPRWEDAKRHCRSLRLKFGSGLFSIPRV